MNAELPPFRNGEHNSESMSIIDRVITPLIWINESRIADFQVNQIRFLTTSSIKVMKFYVVIATIISRDDFPSCQRANNSKYMPITFTDLSPLVIKFPENPTKSFCFDNLVKSLDYPWGQSCTAYWLPIHILISMYWLSLQTFRALRGRREVQITKTFLWVPHKTIGKNSCTLSYVSVYIPSVPSFSVASFSDGNDTPFLPPSRKWEVETYMISQEVSQWEFKQSFASYKRG